jgi:hypothetical protein
MSLVGDLICRCSFVKVKVVRKNKHFYFFRLKTKVVVHLCTDGGNGGTGSAFKEVITNGRNDSNCYNYSTLSRKVILKAYEVEVGSFYFICPN